MGFQSLGVCARVSIPKLYGEQDLRYVSGKLGLVTMTHGTEESRYYGSYRDSWLWGLGNDERLPRIKERMEQLSIVLGMRQFSFLTLICIRTREYNVTVNEKWFSVKGGCEGVREGKGEKREDKGKEREGEREHDRRRANQRWSICDIREEGRREERVKYVSLRSYQKVARSSLLRQIYYALHLFGVVYSFNSIFICFLGQFVMCVPRLSQWKVQNLLLNGRGLLSPRISVVSEFMKRCI